jgi:putative membrane protein
MIINLVITIAVLVGLVLLVVWAVKKFNQTNSQTDSRNTSGDSARDIVQARYAKGELSREEYQQILSDLSR